MKKNEDQFPEGTDWSWTSEAMDERTEQMKKHKEKDKGGDVNLLKKETWKKPPF